MDKNRYANECLFEKDTEGLMFIWQYFLIVSNSREENGT